MLTAQDYFKNPPIIESSPYVETPPFIYPYQGIYEEDVPFYLKPILVDPSISNIERKIFVDKFLKKFLTNENYRNEVMGKFLLFEGNKFKGIVEDESEAWNYGTGG